MPNETLSFKCQNEEAYIKEEMKIFSRLKQHHGHGFGAFTPFR